jgi:hypothetical protein
VVNERSKRLMGEQKSGIFGHLKSFQLPVFEDEVAEDEDERLLNSNAYNYFVFETSDFKKTNDIKFVTQDIYVSYYSENRDDLDEQTIDIISLIDSVKGVSFSRSVKERLRVKETDRFIDRVTIMFTRKIPIEC